MKRPAPGPALYIIDTSKHNIIGQVPGIKVHETGIAMNDPSVERLPDWIQINRNIFYDASRIAIMPMGVCYPERLARGGDKPPRPKCVLAGHDRVLAELPKLKRTLFVELYAQGYYLGDRPEKSGLQR